LSGLKWTVLGAGAGAERHWVKPVGPAREVSYEWVGRALVLTAVICELVNNRPTVWLVAVARERGDSLLTW